jgi:hypothetical protein
MRGRIVQEKAHHLKRCQVLDNTADPVWKVRSENTDVGGL